MKALYKALNIFLGVQMLFFVSLHGQDGQEIKNPWSGLYYKTFAQDESETHKDKLQIFFAKDDLPLFNQLIFSWNAERPDKGYFSFWVQVHDAKNNQWSTWHRMSDWGAGVQRSYLSKSDGIAYNNFVSLTMSSNLLGDAFRVKAVVHDGASLALLKACAVSLSHESNFKSEVFDAQLASLPSIYIRNVPTISQFALVHPRNNAICSPTSCTMLTSFLSGKTVNPIHFAQNSFDAGLGVHGSWPFNMAHAYEICDGLYWFFTTRLNSFVGLHQRLKQGFPVVVSVRGPLEGAAAPYQSGHLLTVVGWDAKKQEVIVHDPAFKTDRETVHRYPLNSFLQAWEKSRRLTYLVEENQLKNERKES